MPHYNGSVISFAQVAKTTALQTRTLFGLQFLIWPRIRTIRYQYSMGCFGRHEDNDYEGPRLMLMKYIYNKRIQRGGPLSHRRVAFEDGWIDSGCSIAPLRRLHVPHSPDLAI